MLGSWDHWVAVQMLPSTTRVLTCDFYSVMLSELQESVLRDLGSSSKDYYVLAAQKLSENHFHWILLFKRVIRASPGSRIRESDLTSQHTDWQRICHHPSCTVVLCIIQHVSIQHVPVNFFSPFYSSPQHYIFKNLFVVSNKQKVSFPRSGICPFVHITVEFRIVPSAYQVFSKYLGQLYRLTRPYGAFSMAQQ